MAAQWQQTGRIVGMGQWRDLLTGVFWIWGLGGFAGVSYEAIGMLQLRAMGGQISPVATTFVAVEVLWWLGGLVMLGLGAVLAGGKLAIERPAEA
jgi:hypothetical protein